MKQTDEKADMVAEGYDSRQREARSLIDERQAGAEYHRLPPRTDYGQQHYRGADRPVALPRPREIEEYDGRDDTARAMAAHPLFRGLLQELPPRTSPPSKEWLDRWSETARSILDLLYSRDPVT